MTGDLLLSIKKAESEAEQIIRNSMADSRRIIAEARRQSTETVKQAVNNAQEESKKILSQAEIAAQAEIEAIMWETEKECDALRREAEGRMNQAVELIVKRIGETYGHC